jgi:hypothetical protein
MFYRFIRNLLILTVVAATIAAVAYFILTGDNERVRTLYYAQVTNSVATAVAGALNDATRTAEAPLRQYRYIPIVEGQTLEEVADRYATTVEAIRMVNGLAPDVVVGDGSSIIIPEGASAMLPARKLSIYTAIDTDTLEALALRFDVPLEILVMDNPVLAQRGIIPGDIVFIPEIL